jgi:hypothetical protein
MQFFGFDAIFCISLLCVRLPEVVLQIPVALNVLRGVQIRFARNDNITAVVEGCVDFYELTEVNIIIWSSSYLLGYIVSNLVVMHAL